MSRELHSVRGQLRTAGGQRPQQDHVDSCGLHDGLDTWTTNKPPGLRRKHFAIVLTLRFRHRCFTHKYYPGKIKLQVIRVTYLHVCHVAWALRWWSWSPRLRIWPQSLLHVRTWKGCLISLICFLIFKMKSLAICNNGFYFRGCTFRKSSWNVCILWHNIGGHE